MSDFGLPFVCGSSLHAGRRARAATVRFDGRHADTPRPHGRRAAWRHDWTTRPRRVPRRYARKGGACERRLRCKTNSANVGESGGRPVAGVAADRSARATEKPGHSIGGARISSEDTSGSFASAGTTAWSDLQHCTLWLPSIGSFAGCEAPLWQHACSFFAWACWAARLKAQ